MYSILRTEKIKDRQQISSAAQHNFRLRTQSNVDDSRTKLNVILVNKLEVDVKVTSSLQEKLTEHYESLGVKEKSDNVLMMEFVVSASPEFFEGKTPGEVKKWADHQVNFFEKEYGKNLQMAILHLDEKTPHIHFMLSTEQETVKTYKNRYGTTQKNTWSLSSKKFNPQYLSDLQTSYAKHNKVFGLKRGEKSTREHIKLKDYYDSIRDMEKELKAKVEEHQKLQKLKEYYPKLKQKIFDLLGTTDRLLGILETKELNSIERQYIDSLGRNLQSVKEPKAKKTV